MVQITDKTCFHVPDYINVFDEQEQLIERLRSILSKGLLTAEEQGRNKNSLEMTPADQLDVWAPDDEHFGIESNLESIIEGFGTSVGLLLDAENEPIGEYPHALVKEGVSPEIKALVINTNIPWAKEKEFISSLQKIALEHEILLLNEKLDIFDIDECLF